MPSFTVSTSHSDCLRFILFKKYDEIYHAHSIHEFYQTDMYCWFLSILIQKLLSKGWKTIIFGKKTDFNHSGPTTQLILFRFCHLQSNVISVRILKYGFCKKSLRKNEALTSWTLLGQFFSRSGKKVSQTWLLAKFIL